MSNQCSKEAQKGNLKISRKKKLKNIEICDVNDKEFKIAILKTLKEMWENTDS